MYDKVSEKTAEKYWVMVSTTSTRLDTEGRGQYKVWCLQQLASC